MFGKRVTLTGAGLEHILLRHPELGRIQGLADMILMAVEMPELVVAGRHGEHIAAKRMGIAGFKGKYLVVAYDDGGEVKTAFVTGRIEKIVRRRVLWKRQSSK